MTIPAKEGVYDDEPTGCREAWVVLNGALRCVEATHKSALPDWGAYPGYRDAPSSAIPAVLRPDKAGVYDVRSQQAREVWDVIMPGGPLSLYSSRGVGNILATDRPWGSFPDYEDTQVPDPERTPVETLIHWGSPGVPFEKTPRESEQPKSEPRAEIPALLDALEKQNILLREAILALSRKLEPVMASPLEPSPRPELEKCDTPLGARLNSIGYDLRVSDSLIRSINTLVALGEP